MSRSSLLRFASFSILASSLAVAACSSGDSARPVHRNIGDVLRLGNASQAELQTVVDTQADDWSWAGGQFDAPENGAVLANDTPFHFVWHSASTEPSEAGAPSQFEVTYLLVFGTPKQGKLLRVFTTLHDFTPDAGAWQKLVDASEPITLSVTSATFIGSELTADGGPHDGQTLTFTIQ